MWSICDVSQALNLCLPSTLSPVHRIVFDTRHVIEHDLFVALKTTQDDGGHYIDQALKKKAAMVLTSESWKKQYPQDNRVVAVPCPYKALTQLAQYRRNQTKSSTFFSVTGSIGKTTVKEGLRHIFQCYASQKNYNNQLGLPWTLANMPVSTLCAVCEIGMDHPGEILPLARLVQTNIAVITRIAPVHLKHMISVQNIIQEKANIMGEDSFLCDHAIFPAEGEGADYFKTYATQRAIPFTTFGFTNLADIFCESYNESQDTTHVTVRLPQGTLFSYVLSCRGYRGVYNSLILVAALWLKDPKNMELYKPRLLSWKEPEGRGNIIQCPHKNITLWDESYNASPVSMRESLNIFLSHTKPSADHRFIVLGDMNDLGDNAISYHTDLADLFTHHTVQGIICIGPLMKHLYVILGKTHTHVHWFSHIQQATDYILSVLQPGDVIFLKGSYTMKLSYCVEKLTSGV